MIKLFLKIILLVLSLFLVLNLANIYFPFDAIDVKKSCLELKKEYYSKGRYNTIFIGSSRVYRQISPVIFDSYENKDTHSFNFGIPGYQPIQSMSLLRDILSSNAPLPETVFMELGIPANSTDAPKTVKTRLAKFENDFDKFTKRGMGPSIINMFLDDGEIEKLPERWLGKNKDGYYPLDMNLADKSNDSGDLKLRKLEFEGDPQAVSKIKMVSTQKIKEGKEIKRYNIEVQKSLNDLIADAAKMNVKLIFIVMPLMNHEYMNIIPLAYELPPTNLLNLADPSEFPEFYDARYMFDHAHLNEAGAKLFTEKLSLKYKSLPL